MQIIMADEDGLWKQKKRQQKNVSLEQLNTLWYINNYMADENDLWKLRDGLEWFMEVEGGTAKE